MKRMLLVFAHPDDESFAAAGTVAKYIKAGWQVDLICATRGEAGNSGPFGPQSPEELGRIRQKEAETAGIILGISSVTFLGYADGGLARETPGEIEEAVYKKMAEIVPDVVITFDTAGISNHPDHIKLCYATTYAFQKFASWVEDTMKERGDVSEDLLPKLYYACMPESTASYLKKKKMIPAESFGRPWNGTPDKFVTTVINIDKFRSSKKKALRAHVSQTEDVDRFFGTIVNPLLRHEYFILRLHGSREVFMGKYDKVSNAL